MHLKFTILLLLSIYPFIFGSKYVVIPFKKNQISSTGNHKEVIQLLGENTLNTKIQIGTPYQQLLLNIQSDNHYTYIISEDSVFLDDNEPEDLVEFSNSQSKSFQQLTPVYFLYDLFSKAYYMKDNIKISDSIINDLTLIEAVEIKDTRDLTLDSGILGLGIVNSYETGKYHSNFIYNLKEKEIIDSYDFFIEYDNETNGKIIIGTEPFYYNNNIYKNKINTFARPPSYSTSVYWGFMIDKMTYQGVEIKQDIFYAKIKLNYGFISVGRAIKEILDKKYFNTLKNQQICQEVAVDFMNSNYVCKKGQFDKSKLGTLEILNLEYHNPFIIDLSQMFYEKGEYSYFLLQFSGDSIILLGEPFLRNNTVLFNQDKKMIGTYQNIKPENKRETNYLVILLVVFICLSIIIISLVIFLKYGKKMILRKKMKGIELVDENSNYESLSEK